MKSTKEVIWVDRPTYQRIKKQLKEHGEVVIEAKAFQPMVVNEKCAVFVDGVEIESIDCGGFKLEDDTTMLPVTMSTIYGDVEFTAVFTKQQFEKYLTVCQKMNESGDNK